jgi:hypothetical protein
MAMTDEVVCLPRKGRRITPVPDQTVLANAPATISVTITDQDGEAITPGDPVTVEVQDSNGNDIVTSGTATTAVQDSFTVDIPAGQVDMLTAFWTYDTTTVTTNVEVAGGYYFPLTQLRHAPDIVDSGSRYSDEDLVDARRWSESMIDEVCGSSFVERYQSDILVRSDFLYASSSVGTRLRFPDPFLREIYGIALDSAEFDQIADLTILNGGRADAGNLATAALDVDWTRATPRYVSAFRDQCPPDLSLAALRAARDYLTSFRGNADLSDQTSSGPDPMQTPTGAFDVDGPVIRWRNRVQQETELLA